MKNKYYKNTVTVPIDVSNHAIQRFKLRLQKQDMSDLEATRKIVNYVRRSKLVEINGSKEIRSYNGLMFVIQRKFNHDSIGFLQEKVVVITMLMSKLRLREHFSEDFSDESVDFSKVIGVVS